MCSTVQRSRTPPQASVSPPAEWGDTHLTGVWESLATIGKSTYQPHVHTQASSLLGPHPKIQRKPQIISTGAPVDTCPHL
jgi:hypothetical protein